MTKLELETPTFKIFEEILGDSFHKIEKWLEPKPGHGHYYLGKNEDLTNPKCGESDDIKGFDVPVLIKKDEGNNKKLMIIVGESPLRNGTENGLFVGFPFAVDYIMGKPHQCDVYKELFNKLLIKGYDLYITDIIKVWEKNKKLTVGKNDRKILAKELGILHDMGVYNDIHILLMGSKAEKWKINGEDYKCINKRINIPHMSKQNWDTWRIKIYEDAFRKLINDGKITKENIEGLFKFKKDTNELEFCSMNAGTVAKTAFEMIEKMIK